MTRGVRGLGLMFKNAIETLVRVLWKRAATGPRMMIGPRMKASHEVVEDAVWRPLTNLIWSFGHDNVQRFLYWSISNSAGDLQARLYWITKDDPDHPALKDFLIEKCSHDCE